ERVVDRFLDRGQQRLPRVVEAEQVAVLGKKLADRDVALAGGHRVGGGAPFVALGRAVGAGGLGHLFFDFVFDCLFGGRFGLGRFRGGRQARLCPSAGGSLLRRGA